MGHILYILRDDDFDTPIYAGIPIDDLDEDVWNSVMEVVHEAVENGGPRTGFSEVSEYWIGWRHSARSGISFVAVLDEEYEDGSVEEFLTELATHYMGEVDDVRFPDAEGLEDVLVDVIPPWDE